MEWLRRFCAPLGLTVTELVERAGVVVGRLAPRPVESIAFGGGMPRGPGAVALLLPDGAVLETGTASCATLFACEGGAWSTHAVAAAVVATGRASVRPEAPAELCA